MVSLARYFTAACCLLFAAGCLTDELAVYEDSVVGQEARQRFLGVYRVEEWPSAMEPERIRVTEEGGELIFSYTLPDKKYRARFVLSKVPESQQDLYLLAIPSQPATNQANLFLIGRAGEQKTHLWVVSANLPVAKGNLTFRNGKASAEDVKSFLAQRGDAFVAANDPPVTLTNPSR